MQLSPAWVIYPPAHPERIHSAELELDGYLLNAQEWREHTGEDDGEAVVVGFTASLTIAPYQDREEVRFIGAHFTTLENAMLAAQLGALEHVLASVVEKLSPEVAAAARAAMRMQDGR